MEAQRQHLHIIVNEIKYDDDRVKPKMSVPEIAALAGVEPDEAIVREETGRREGWDLRADLVIDIYPGTHFIVTRKVV